MTATAASEPPGRLLLTVEEAADLLRIGRSKAYDLVRNHDLESVKIGRLRRVPLASVHDFAARLIAEGRAAA